MMNKKRILMITCIFGIGLILMSCAGMPTKPTEANFKAPAVALESVQVTQYNGFWHYDAKATPTKGKAGANSAMLPMAFLFNITNPNDYPVKLDGFGFTVAFDDFEVNMVNAFEMQWIPAGKTNQLSVMSIVDVQQVLLSLLIPNYEKVKAKNTNAWALLEKWWTEIPNMTVPIEVKKGAATFTADGVQKVIPFTAKFPK
jgi:LEA14-like dessication related protein